MTDIDTDTGDDTVTDSPAEQVTTVPPRRLLIAVLTIAALILAAATRLSGRARARDARDAGRGPAGGD